MEDCAGSIAGMEKFGGPSGSPFSGAQEASLCDAGIGRYDSSEGLPCRKYRLGAQGLFPEVFIDDFAAELCGVNFIAAFEIPAT